LTTLNCRRLPVFVLATAQLLLGCRADHEQAARNSVEGEFANAEDVASGIESVRLSLAPNVELTTPWEAMHMALGVGTNVEMVDESSPNRIPLLQYIQGRAGPNQYTFDEHGPIVEHTTYPRVGQGHTNQFLACLAQCGLPPETKLVADGDVEFSLQDMLEAAASRWSAGDELPWTVIAFCHYRRWGEEWSTATGETVSLNRLAEQLMAFASGACGGTHRLCALVCVLHSIDRAGQSELPVARRIRSTLDYELERVKGLQLADGSISPIAVQYNIDPSSPPRRLDAAKIYATGHVLEWVIPYLGANPPEWVPRGVEYLTSQRELFLATDVSASWRFHALHALRLFVEVQDPSGSPQSCAFE
jgi:hypothetical protein